MPKYIGLRVMRYNPPATNAVEGSNGTTGVYQFLPIMQ